MPLNYPPRSDCRLIYLQPYILIPSVFQLTLVHYALISSSHFRPLRYSTPRDVRSN